MLRTEWAKLAPMSFTEKRQYIWEYYKLHIIVFLVVAFFTGSLINTLILNPPRQEYLYFVWIGPPVTSFVLEDFAEELNIIVENPSRYVVRATNYNMQGLDPQMAMGLQARFVAQMQMRSLDLFMLTKEELYDFSSGGFILPIISFMEGLEQTSPAVYNALKERLTEITFFSEEQDIVITDFMAANMNGIRFFEKFDIQTDNLYLAVVINSERFERAARALEVIFGV